MKLRPDDSRLSHADAVLCGVYSGTGCKLVIAGRKGIPVVFLPLKLWAAKAFRIFKKHAKRFCKFIILLNQRLVINFL